MIRLLKPLSLIGCGHLARGLEIDLTKPNNDALVSIGYAEYVDPPAKEQDKKSLKEPTPKPEKEKEAK